MKRIISAALAVTMLSGAALPASAETPNMPASASAETTVLGKLAKPAIKVKAKGSDYITLCWSKVNGASGYKIYKKVGSSYKTVGTVRSGSTVKFKVKNLKAGKRYTFKARAFKKTSSGTKFSPYSKALYASTKPESSTYKKIIAKYKKEHGNSEAFSRYFIVDLDKNGIKELMIESDACNFDFYTISGGRTLFIGSEYFFEFSGLYKNSGHYDAVTFCSAVHRVNRLSVKNGKLTRKTVYEWKGDSSTDPDTKIEKYVKDPVGPKYYNK